MGKVITKPGPKNPQGGKHIIRIMFDDNEPPKNYIWGKPDGFFYRWNGFAWVPTLLNDTIAFEEDCDFDCSCSCSANWVTKDFLDKKMDELRKGVLAQVIKMRDDPCNNLEAIEEAIRDINARLDSLEDQLNALSDTLRDNYYTKVESDNRYYTKTEINNNYYTKQEIDDRALNRDEFEALALELGFVKMKDITLAEYEALPEVEPNMVYNITDAEAYHFDPTGLQNQIDSLDTRVDALEAIDHSQFVTADDFAEYTDPETSPYASKNDVAALTDALNNLDIPSLDGYATEQWVENKNYLTEHQSLSNYSTTQQMNTAIQNAIDGIDIPSLDGYATEQYVDDAVAGIDVPSIAGLATVQYVDNKVAGVVNSAPETLDTLKELSDALGSDPNFAATMATELGKKANIADLAAVATSGSYNDLTNKPTIPTVPTNVSAFTNDAGYLTSHQSLANYSTTAQMNTAIANATNDMATQSWAEDTFEYKFGDLTGEADPIAEAKTHTSDDKVYITAIEEEE